MKKLKKSFIILLSLYVFIFINNYNLAFALQQENVFKGIFKNTDYSNIELFLNCGEQTKITDDIMKVANQFNDKKDISTVSEIYNWMIQNLKYGDGEKFKRTSDEIMKSKMFTGCTDMGLIFASLARAKGIPTVFLQTARIDWIEKRVKNTLDCGSIVGHILVEVYLQDKWYLVDSTAGKLFLDYDKNNFSLPDGYYVFSKSIEVFDMGTKDEMDNHEKMMNLFKNFDISLYKNPLYDYIDLTTNRKMKSAEFIYDKESLKKSTLILGDKAPAELFDKLYTPGISNKKLCSYDRINNEMLTNVENLVLLHYSQYLNNFPPYLIDLVPEIKNFRNGSEFIISRSNNKQRIIVANYKTKDSLLKAIEDMPFDILYKDYNIISSKSTTSIQKSTTKKVYYLKTNSYLTKTPTSNFNKNNIICLIPKNTQINITGTYNKNYYRVNYKNKTGYILIKNVSSK